MEPTKQFTQWVRAFYVHAAKINFLLILFVLALVPVAFCQGDTGRLTVSVKNGNLQEIFAKIEAQSSYRIFYLEKELQGVRPISLSVKDVTIRQLLDKVLEGSSLIYKQNGTSILVKPKVASKTDHISNVPLSDTFRRISGRVLSAEDGTPLPGATVKVKDMAMIGNTTDEQGYFHLDILATVKFSSIVVTFLGYNQKEVSIAAIPGSNLIISMEVGNKLLDETVVIGYGTTNKRYNTGSVAKVTAEAIGNQPISNSVSALQGRAPGLYINTTNGLPGGNYTVQIRGINSIGAGRDPLYIVDGVPFSSTPLSEGLSSLNFNAIGPVNPLSVLNPSEISSIEILKDADATAIYGSRGANGVILITTKKGTVSKSTLEFDFYKGANKVARLPKMLGLKDYLMIRREAYQNDHLIPSGDPSSSTFAPDLMVWDTTKETDWVKYFMGSTAAVTNITASLSGGAGGTTYRLGAGYRDEGTIFPGRFGYQKASLRLNMLHLSTNKKFRVSYNANVNYDKNNQVAQPVESIISLPPNYSPVAEDGSLNWQSVSGNPLALGKSKLVYRTNNFIFNTNVQYSLLPNLFLKVDAGYTYTNIKQVNTYPKESQNPTYGEPVNYSVFGSNNSFSVIVEPQLNFERSLGKHDFKVMVGGTYQVNTKEVQSVQGANYTNESLQGSLSGAGMITDWGDINTSYKFASAFSRISWVYDKRYFVNLTGRRDGSSRFGTGNQFGNFGAIGAAWIFSSEEWAKEHISFISYGKIRGSYGLTGNDQIAEYQYLSAYSPLGTYQNVRTLNPSRIANVGYGWETNLKKELGLDMGVLRDRLLLTLNYFNNTSGNQLVLYPLPYMSGPFGSYQANLPAKVKNDGWEIELSSENVVREQFHWSSSFNISFIRNRLVKFPGLEKTSYDNSLIIGDDLSVIRGFKSTGISPDDGSRLYYDAKGIPVKNPVYFTDYYTLGKQTPYWYGGLSNKFSYKGFQLDMFIQFSNQDVRGVLINPGSLANTFYLAKYRWQKPGDQTTVRKATTYPDFMALASDISLKNVTYFRLKTLMVSYKIPKRIVENTKLVDVILYLEGQNLLTLVKNNGFFDPETGIGGVPPMRSFVGGIRITL